ncbi:hypothetical protein [Brunnivagina elsteri]|uniref:Uncharacterized protein n=1 Tax=Brunnivagina elsteri CCALA 953 TaxID=987040 RepID=A0A2A2TPH3_9CYAN|nr:hypothetical protein [Calothrix elsteri]PAX60343.1 hypothetical protein CK510_02200 [Calothrix elsteri CCALA 953]
MACHKIRLFLAGFAVLWERVTLLNTKSKKAREFRKEVEIISTTSFYDSSLALMTPGWNKPG